MGAVGYMLRYRAVEGSSRGLTCMFIRITLVVKLRTDSGTKRASGIPGRGLLEKRFFSMREGRLEIACFLRFIRWPRKK